MDMGDVVVNEKQTIESLVEIDKQIQKSLHTECTDVDKCLAVMQELEVLLLQVTDVMLKKYPDIVATIKKCRKCQGSEKVQQKAVLIYRQLQMISMANWFKKADEEEEYA